MLKAVFDRQELLHCQKRFVDRLKCDLNRVRKVNIGYPGGNFAATINYNNDFWFSTKNFFGEEVAIPRYWNGFGLGVKDPGILAIAVEVNFPLEGIKRSLSGIFAKDEIGKYYILSRGKIGGGCKGVGKNAFLNWYRGDLTEVLDHEGNIEEAICIASLESRNFLRRIYSFIKDVSDFKAEVRHGESLRSNAKNEKNSFTEFSPEFFGRKGFNVNRTIRYESSHGIIVNELEKYLKADGRSSSYRIFNNRLIDLGLSMSGQLQSVYEVKCSTDRQAIYSAIGQLFFHSEGRGKVTKVMVLPEDGDLSNVKSVLNKIGISLLTYKINGLNVKFKEF